MQVVHDGDALSTPSAGQSASRRRGKVREQRESCPRGQSGEPTFIGSTSLEFDVHRARSLLPDPLAGTPDDFSSWAHACRRMTDGSAASAKDAHGHGLASWLASPPRTDGPSSSQTSQALEASVLLAR